MLKKKVHTIFGRTLVLIDAKNIAENIYQNIEYRKNKKKLISTIFTTSVPHFWQLLTILDPRGGL